MRPSPKKTFGNSLVFLRSCCAGLQLTGGVAGSGGAYQQRAVEQLVKLLEDRSAEHVLMETESKQRNLLEAVLETLSHSKEVYDVCSGNPRNRK